MKKIFVILLSVLVMIACETTSNQLLVKKEQYDVGSLINCDTYKYVDGELTSSLHLSYYKDRTDTIYSEYESFNKDGITVTITTNTYIDRDGKRKERTLSGSDGTFHNYYLDGDDKWIESSRGVKDKEGRILERISDNYHSWYTYDTYGRNTGSKCIITDENDSIIRQFESNIIFSDDSLQSICICLYQEGDSPAVITDKYITKYDKKGRMISEDRLDPDETDDKHPDFFTTSYKYNNRGVIEIQNRKTYKEGSYHEEPIIMYKTVYNKRGLEIKKSLYLYTEGKPYLNIFTKYKYDRRSGKPLKQTDYGLSDSRKPWHQTIWTYE